MKESVLSRSAVDEQFVAMPEEKWYTAEGEHPFDRLPYLFA